MLRNYLIIAWRNILKNKVFSIINILGLAVGMAAFLLIIQYVNFETNYDNYHQKADDIYRIRYDSYNDGHCEFKSVASVGALGPALKNEFPEIVEYVRLFPFYTGFVVSYNEQSYRVNDTYIVDPSFFEVFSYELILGNKENLLKDVATVVITEKTAKRIFGDENPVGKEILAGGSGGQGRVTITGIVKDPPENSHFTYELLISWSTLLAVNGDNEANESWDWYDFYTYIRLAPGTDYKALESKFPEFIQKYTPNSERKYVLQPIRDIHLKSHFLQEMEINGNVKFIRILAIIAFFILFIAWVNYINLSTSRSMERSREVGVRKVNGASQKKLILQFLFESFLINIISIVLAFTIYQIIAPVFNNFAGKNFIQPIWYDINIWLYLVSLIFIGTLLPGIFPAFILSSFNSLVVIKKSFSKNAGGSFFRKVLVVFQFIIAIILISSMIIINNQVKFMRNYDLGVNIDQTLVVKGPELGEVSENDLYNTNIDIRSVIAFRDELLKQSSINSFTTSSNVPGEEITSSSGLRRVGTENEYKTVYEIDVDYDYIDAFDLKILAGRNFSQEYGSDDRCIILNETTVKLLGYKSINEALNSQVTRGGGPYKVIGIIADYNQMGLKEEKAPIIYRLRYNTGFFAFKISGYDISNTIKVVKTKYEELFPKNPFEFYFLDEQFNKQYETDSQFGILFSVFAFLGIIISCLGLFGLSSYTIIQRTKEIGIRKTLGSTKRSLLLLLSKEFIDIVCVSTIVAMPLTYYIMIKWLENYAYKAPISWLFFLATFIIVILISGITLSYQVIKTASDNPVKALRYE